MLERLRADAERLERAARDAAARLERAAALESEALEAETRARAENVARLRHARQLQAWADGAAAYAHAVRAADAWAFVEQHLAAAEAAARASRAGPMHGAEGISRITALDDARRAGAILTSRRDVWARAERELRERMTDAP